MYHLKLIYLIEADFLYYYHGRIPVISEENPSCVTNVAGLIGGVYIIFDKAKIYSRPNISSTQWAEIRRGITVLKERSQGDFVQISYKEGDHFPEPNYITYQITGWTEKSNLASIVTRQFYHFQSNSQVDEWEIETDNHRFKLFWSPLDCLPQIVSPQREWIDYILNDMNNL